MSSPGAAPPPSSFAALWFFAAVVAVVFAAPLSATWSAAPDLGHAWVVPLLMAYLWWERWNERPLLAPARVSSPLLWIGALVLVALHLGIRLFLTPFPLWPAALFAYTLVLAIAILAPAWLVAGRAGLRWIAGPLLLLPGALPVPTAIENAIVLPLRETWAALAAEVSNLLGQPAFAFGTSLRVGQAWVGVDEACGGIRSLQACILAGLFLGEWLRFSLARRALLLVAAIAAALVGNFLRVLFLSLRAAEGPDALAAAHDPAGWLAMAFSLLATGWLASHWNGYKLPAQQPPAPRRAPAAPLPRALRFSIAAVAALLLVNEALTRAWYAFGRRTIADVPQWTAEFPEKRPSFRPYSLSDHAREILRPDVFHAGSWRDENRRLISAYYIEWNSGQVARSIPFLHNPTVCLPAAGCELVDTLAPFEISTPCGTIPFHAYKFRRAGEDILVAFTIWDSSRGRPLVAPEISSRATWWSAQWHEVKEARQHQPAQLLSIVVEADSSLEVLKTALASTVLSCRKQLPN